MADELLIPIKVVKRGSAKGKVLGETQPANVNKPLKRALAKAYKWDEDLMNAEDRDRYLFQNNLSRRYVQRILKFNCISPKIKKMIIDGTFPQDILLQDLIYKELPLMWKEQEMQILGKENN